MTKCKQLCKTKQNKTKTFTKLFGNKKLYTTFQDFTTALHNFAKTQKDFPKLCKKKKLYKTLQDFYTTLQNFTKTLHNFKNCTTLDKKALYTALHNYTNLKTTLKTNKLRMSQKYITPKYFTRLFNFFLKQKLHNT